MTAPDLSTSPRRWWALGALALSVLIIGLDGTIINVALPTIADDLGADSAQLQWISGGYLLTLSACMLPVGILGDRYGQKRLLLTGIGLFGVASLAGAVVGTTGAVIAVRTLLGVGAAMIMPLSMALLPRIFAKEEIPKAIAVWTAAAALGMPIGPVVGGWLLDHFWWGSVFLFNIPVVVVALVAAAWLLPGDRAGTSKARARSARFDAPGTVLGAAAITAIVYGTILVPRDGWGSPAVLASLIAGVVLAVAFVVRERTYAHPLVDLGLFSQRGFLWGTLMAIFGNFAIMGILFVVPQYLEGVLGNDSLGTGVRVLPLMGGLLVSATLSENLVPRFGARIVMPTGLAVLAAGALLGARLDSGDGYGFTALWLSVTGLGFGMVMVPATSMALSSLTTENSGQGASLLETVQQLGGVLGVAGLGSLLSAGYLDRLSVTGLPDAAADAARDSVTASNAVAGQLKNPDLLASGHAAFIHGMSLVLIACAVLSLLTAVLSAVFLPSRTKAPAPDTDDATDTAPDPADDPVPTAAQGTPAPPSGKSTLV
ncbi:MFS transporter [Streptomyces sp. NPDC048275]|uniref:MFS transporter n=1 Tax=Streptomyces sp. NPDC048275 TaxID=3155629 RepID=UPI0033EB93A4